jgi:hypothetical protein
MTPNPKAIAAALSEPVDAYLKARAFAEVEKERVEKIQKQVLAEGTFYGHHKKRSGEGEHFRVTDPKDSWLMDDADAARYFEILNQIHLAAGFEKAKDGYCPALVAEHEQTKAERALIDASSQFFPTVTNETMVYKLREQWIDTVVKLVLAAKKEV